MKKKILSVTLILLLALTTAAGCEKKEDTTDKKETTKTEETKKTQESEKKEEMFKTIGDKTDSSFEVKLTNGTGQDITGFSIKDSDESQYPANLLKSEDKFAKDETRVIYYTAKTKKDAATETGKVLPIEYTVQLTFADSTVSELHAFPFEDMKEGKISIEDKMAYVTYKSTNSKEEVSTLEAEKAVKAQADAKSKSEADAAAAAAAAQAQAEADAAAAAQAQADADAAAAAQAQAAADAAAAAQAQAEADAAAAEQQQPTDNGGTEGGQEDACLNDGLTY